MFSCQLRFSFIRSCKALSIATLLAPIAAMAADPVAYPVAGVSPDQRPSGAPVIQHVIKEDGWYQKALHGITPPYPASLKFLEDQGNWFTPFTRPGMTGRYDLREWHSK